MVTRSTFRPDLIGNAETLINHERVASIEEGIEDLLMQGNDYLLLARDWDFQYSVQDDIRGVTR